jgi:hypothetical protein
MTLTNGKEIDIENIKVKVKIIERHNNCENCALKGQLCVNRTKYGIKRCYIGNSPIIFEEVVNETLKQEIKTLLNLKIDKNKILEKYNLTEEQFNYIVDKKI